MALRHEGFWDEHYGLELRNYQDAGDEGEVWFGKGLSRRIVNWLLARLSPNSEAVTRILDIGCGNAFTLLTLVEKCKSNQFKSEHIRLLGIDYSSNSISLSEKIVADKGLSDGIKLKQCDFLDANSLEPIRGEDIKYDFLIDIGTYDAICLLSADSTERLEKTKLKYLESLHSLVKSGSIFILASCNHTEEELMPLFEPIHSHHFTAKLIDRIETPTIQFGGKQGSQVTCLILEFHSD